MSIYWHTTGNGKVYGGESFPDIRDYQNRLRVAYGSLRGIKITAADNEAEARRRLLYNYPTFDGVKMIPAPGLRRNPAGRSWRVSPPGGKYLGEIEFQDQAGEWHNFSVLSLPDRLVFGSVANAGFIESGFMRKESWESVSEAAGELQADLETYYNDGPQYVSRIIVNERM